MSRSFQCEALHGDISQSERERTLAGFRDGRFNILIATDVASRGLDIPNVDLVCASPSLSYLHYFLLQSPCASSVVYPHAVLLVQVIHFELPNSSEIFVHRSGRTGRAGKKGTAIVMYNYEQSRAVRVIERDVGCKFTEVGACGLCCTLLFLGCSHCIMFTWFSFALQLPKINVEGSDLLGGGFDSFGGGGGGYGGSNYGRSRGGFGGRGGGGGFGRSGGGGFGNSGFGRSSGGFGDSGFGRSGGGGFGDSGFGRSGGGGGFSDSGFGRSGGSGGGFSDSGSGRFGGGFGSSRSGSFGGFGDKDSR
jgi:hypothetical protein